MTETFPIENNTLGPNVLIAGFRKRRIRIRDHAVLVQFTIQSQPEDI